jgi:hypothetical protein
MISAAGAQPDLSPGAVNSGKPRSTMPLSIWVIPATAAVLLGFAAVVALT